MAKLGWLRCESIERGMFSDELAVVVRRRNGGDESHFVPASSVDKGRSRVRVQVSEAGPVTWATLPTPQPISIAVDKSLLAFK